MVPIWREVDCHSVLIELCLEILNPFYLSHLLAVLFHWVIQFSPSGLQILL